MNFRHCGLWRRSNALGDAAQIVHKYRNGFLPRGRNELASAPSLMEGARQWACWIGCTERTVHPPFSAVDMQAKMHTLADDANRKAAEMEKEDADRKRATAVAEASK